MYQLQLKFKRLAYIRYSDVACIRAISYFKLELILSAKGQMGQGDADFSGKAS